MYTKDSKPYLYAFLSRIAVPTGATGLQYDVYPMSIEGQPRFFMNLVHGENVVLESSVMTSDLPYIKALVDGTINAKKSYALSDGTMLEGAEVINRIDATLNEILQSYQSVIDIFTIMGQSTAHHIDAVTPPAPPSASNDIGVDVQAIFNRLSNRSGKTLPDA